MYSTDRPYIVIKPAGADSWLAATDIQQTKLSAISDKSVSTDLILYPKVSLVHTHTHKVSTVKKHQPTGF